MKTLTFLTFCIVFLSSCSGQIIVWNMKDIIGLIIIGLLAVFICFVWIVSTIQDAINNYKKKKK